jgi:Tfp pilus assembly protein FimT
MVLVIVVVLFAISIPIATNAYRGYHLTAASSQAAGAIQAARYQAVSTGCPYTITLPSSSTTYQLATEVISGSPPACAGTYSNVGESISYSTSGDVSVNSGTTTLVLTMNPNGIVTATGGAASCTGAVGCFVLTNSKSTNTIKVSGVGNVTVTSP